MHWTTNDSRFTWLHLMQNMATFCCTTLFAGCHDAVLERFVALFPHIVSFLEEIYHPVAKLDTQLKMWLCDLADIIRYSDTWTSWTCYFRNNRSSCEVCNLYKAVSSFTGKFSVQSSRGEWKCSPFSIHKRSLRSRWGTSHSFMQRLVHPSFGKTNMDG